MLREVRLYGHLGRSFGRVHRFDVATAQEALQALMVNFPGFEAHLRTHSAPGYRVLVGDGAVMQVEELITRHAPERGVIKIVPAIAGRKKGWGRILAGYVLVAVGTLLTAVGYGAVGKFVAQAGVGLMLSGVTQLLTPVPRSPGPSERPENTPSYFFDGAVNMTAQGQPVPLLYGRLIVGSAVVSAGFSAEDIVLAQPPAPPPPPLPPEEIDNTGLIGGGN